MKKLIALVVFLFCVLGLCACNPQNPSNQGAETNKGSLSDEGYFTPDYQSTSKLHSDEFLEILKCDGYYRDGEKDHNYNTDNITSIVNITPKSISDETPDVEIFYVNTHCFLMVNQTIYRYETFSDGDFHCSAFATYIPEFGGEVSE